MFRYARLPVCRRRRRKGYREPKPPQRVNVYASTVPCVCIRTTTHRGGNGAFAPTADIGSAIVVSTPHASRMMLRTGVERWKSLHPLPTLLATQQSPQARWRKYPGLTWVLENDFNIYSRMLDLSRQPGIGQKDGGKMLSYGRSRPTSSARMLTTTSPFREPQFLIFSSVWWSHQ